MALERQVAVGKVHLRREDLGGPQCRVVCRGTRPDRARLRANLAWEGPRSGGTALACLRSMRSRLAAHASLSARPLSHGPETAPGSPPSVRASRMTNVVRFLVSGAWLAGIWLVPAPASARPCAADGSCGVGEHCESREVSGTCLDCAGASCPPCAPPAVEKLCMVDRIACSTDVDCPGYLTCEQTVFQTSCVGCPDPAPLPPKQTHTCVFRERSCTQESDCADGLLCLPSRNSECSVTGSAEPVCTPRPWSVCTFRPIPCASVADCPCDFTCDVVAVACNSPDGTCGTSTTRFCKARGVAFGVTADGTEAVSEAFVFSSDPRPPVAATGRGNTASTPCDNAAPTNGSATPAAPGCALSPSSPDSPFLPAVAALVGLFALRRRSDRQPRARNHRAPPPRAGDPIPR